MYMLQFQDNTTTDNWQEIVTDVTDEVERAGYRTIKQMVDEMKVSGQIYQTTRGNYHDFDSEDDIESMDPALWSLIQDLRSAGIDDFDLNNINTGFVEYMTSKLASMPKPDASAPITNPPQPPPQTSDNPTTLAGV